MEQNNAKNIDLVYYKMKYLGSLKQKCWSTPVNRWIWKDLSIWFTLSFDWMFLSNWNLIDFWVLATWSWAAFRAICSASFSPSAIGLNDARRRQFCVAYRSWSDASLDSFYDLSHHEERQAGSVNWFLNLLLLFKNTISVKRLAIVISLTEKWN